MTNAELIAALRHCSDEIVEYCVDANDQCPMRDGCEMDLCKAKLMSQAADLIEAQQADLQKANEIIAEGIKVSRKSRAALETAEKLIAELEAQIQKGEQDG